MNVVKIKKFFTIILAIIVSFLVIIAVYTNKSRFYNSETLKYSTVTIDDTTDINDIIDNYSSHNNRDKLISEIKKVNDLSCLSDEEVYGKTIYIPLINN
jgi:hypothetical protein